MFNYNLSERKYFFSSLNLKGGRIEFGNNFYLKNGWIFVNVEYKSYSIHISKESGSWFKPSVFEVRTKDTSNLVWDPYHGDYYKTIKKNLVFKEALLETVQLHINFVDRYNRLKVFS